MRVLALDTTTRAGSVALVEDDRVIVERAGDSARSHAERLPGDLLRVLDERGIAAADVDVFAVGGGPGSFTGLRIGIATVQGLAFATRRRIVAISVLEALAQAASGSLQPGAIVASWMEAYRREVFTALYRVAEGAPFASNRLTEIDGPSVAEPAATLARWAETLPAPEIFVGDGAVAHAGLLSGHGYIMEPPLLAGVIGLMGVERAAAGQAVDAARIQPLYVRRPDAEIDRDRRRAQQQP